jgi:hypothetical protein
MSRAGFSTVLVFSTGLAAAAVAQTTEAEVRETRKNFDDCFYNSISGQITTGPRTEINAMAEKALQACATEEQAIIALLSKIGVPTNTITEEVLKIKVSLKNTARNIAAHPEKYAK